jgi:membrane protease YdiL (CAAX protease family)
MEVPVSDQETGFRWKRRDLIAFACFFLATLFLVPVVSLFEPRLQLQKLSGVQQVLLSAVMDLVLVAFIFFLVRVLHGQSILRTLRAVPQAFPAGRLILGGALLAIAVLVCSSLFPAPTKSPIENLMSKTSSMVFLVAFGIALGPLIEEIIFRGFIFTALEDIYGATPAVPVTAVLFAGLHVTQLWGNWAAVVLIFVVGYVLTVLRKRSGSIIPSVIMHTAYNATLFGVNALALLVAHGAKR